MSSLSAAAANQEVARALQREIQGQVRCDLLSRQLYSTDASDFRQVPLGVVLPSGVADVQAAVTVAAHHRASLVPRGGGSSLSGQAVGAGLVLDMSRHMNRLLEINTQQRWVWVESGLVLDQLNAALAPHGLMVGPDPASSAVATLGGMTGNNSTGSHSIRYGLMVDHVLAVEVVLSDGSLALLEDKPLAAVGAASGAQTPAAGLYRRVAEIVHGCGDEIRQRYPKTWRNVAGYNLNLLHRQLDSGRLNLASLVVGSEGTLAVVTKIKLGVVARPRATRLMILQFDELRTALESVPRILEHRPAAVELMTQPTLKLAHDHPVAGRRLRQFVAGLPDAILIVELAGDTGDAVAADAAALAAAMTTPSGCRRVGHCVAPEEIATVWSIRKAIVGLMASQPKPTKRTGIIDDAAVPVEDLVSFTREVMQAGRRHGVEVNFDAHASAGCLHMCPEFNLKTWDGLRRLELLSKEISAIAMAHGGTTTGEHGDGLARSHFLRQLYGDQLYQAFREIKTLFDPANRLNPGKIVDGREPWDPQWLRIHPGYRTPYDPSATMLDFSAYGGYAGQVEMCNGHGVCRSLVSGTMCPSFRVTREELHSPRGRANALRAALTGELGAAGLASRELSLALDLCLECKACKSECATRVDVAKLKIEFLAHYQAVHGVPLRSRLVGAMESIERIGALAPRFTNRLYRSRSLRRLLELGLNIDARRPLPPLAGECFRRWFRRRAGQARRTSRGAVILWDDCHIRLHQPELGQAAVTLLEAAGFEVRLVPGRRCCGRPKISKGLLRAAREAARHNLARLLPFAAAGLPIVGVEPSCIACFRDEYPDLVPGPEARVVAAQSFFIEEFITALAAKGQLGVAWSGAWSGRRILLHTHCFQKAYGTAEQVVTMLRLLPGVEVQEIASGCCGMAGSFGYETEHYDLSMAIGETALFPAVRAAAADTIIAAAGTSCRQQIKDGSGRQALHPLAILAAALRPTAGRRSPEAWYPCDGFLSPTPQEET
jgi:FAD/FMN-containing dehydrogenase/Fe-S oxidoreductase